MSVAATLTIVIGGCAGTSRRPVPPPAARAAPAVEPGETAEVPSAAPPEAGAQSGETVASVPAAMPEAGAAEPTAVEVPAAEGVTVTVDLQPPEKRKRRVSAPCIEPVPTGEQKIDATRRRLFETSCSAALWFDGLFGDHGDVGAARRTSGRVELSALDSHYYGTKLKSKVNLRVKLPTMERRLEAFVGRDDEEDFVRDRNEGFALRSQFPALERDDRWVLGLGYGLPGSYRKRSDFRLGGKLGASPELFLQARHRQNWYLGDRTLWHFRETLFWTTRDGLGATTALDFDRVLTPNLLLRWGNIGTYSESTEGVDWRVTFILYQNLARGRAIAYEAFVRGETDEEVPLNEYGLRGIFRHPIGARDWLFGELIFGYGWPREKIDESRRGSYLIGVGIELLYGRQ